MLDQDAASVPGSASASASANGAATVAALPGMSPMPRSPPQLSSRSKERRQPSITPRKFQRFFTPRSRVSSRPSKAQRALRDLTAQALNRYQTPSSPLKPPAEQDGEAECLPRTPPPARKRRKLCHTPDLDSSSPLKLLKLPPSPLSSLGVTPVPGAGPNGQSTLLSPIDALGPAQSGLELSESDDEAWGPELMVAQLPAKRIVPLTQRGLAGQLLQRPLGGVPSVGRQVMSRPVGDWRLETAGFCSGPEDVSSNDSMYHAGHCIPFSVAACHTNDLVAVGDEEGRVKLLDTSVSGSAQFSRIHLSFPAHDNAIIDLAFSADDNLLATASGDQTVKVIDMTSQTPISVLDGHRASVKRVLFQPGRGGGNILATSSRDGSIRLWDLRCRAAAVQEFSLDSAADGQNQLSRPVPHCGLINTLPHAHKRQAERYGRKATAADPPEVGVRRPKDVTSVTAIEFLPASREHLLLSACESDAVVKLWDIRNVNPARQKVASPVSFTAEPGCHGNWRPFGISSLSVGADGARLYAVCKDNTVYAYATSHLVLGHAPELSSTRAAADCPPRRRHGAAQQGLGPLYGIRHESFFASSFYVKSAIRPARDGRPELLAVGSSRYTPLIFPTDERYLEYMALSNQVSATLPSSAEQLSLPPPHYDHGPTAWSSSASSQPSSASMSRPSAGNSAALANNGRGLDTIPIYRLGTPLVRGHSKEAGAVAWTSEGSLVTLSDDYCVRRWNDDAARASDLRTGGESAGRRWNCGWADVEPDFDQDDW